MSNESENSIPASGTPEPVRPPYPPVPPQATSSQPDYAAPDHPAPGQAAPGQAAPPQPTYQQPPAQPPYGGQAPAAQPPYAAQQPPYGAQSPYGAQPQYGAQPAYGAPQYADPTVPAPYPGAPMAGAIAPQYPVYGGPSAYAPPTPGSGVGGMAIAALIVGIVAFIFGWVPFFGLLVAAVGVVLGILALRQPRGKGFGITAVVLSGLAALTGIFMLVVFFVLIPASESQF